MRNFSDVKHLRRTALAAAACVLAVALLASPAFGQEDARWLPWVGCWEEVDQYTAEGMLCVRPVEGGVEMLTVVDGEIVASEALSGDGRSHVIEQEGCEGRQSAVFSGDDRRLFVTAGLTCEDEFRRESTGLMALTSPSSWVDVQAVDVGGRNMAMVRHYRLVDDARVEEAGLAGLTAGRELAVRTARYEAASSVDADDVVEATERVDAEAVRAWVAEVGEPFDLSGERLVELADAGVAPDIIDVMVAVSYPDHFVVDRDEAAVDRVAEEYEPYVDRGYRPYYGYWGSRFFFDPFYYRYGAYPRYGGYYGRYYGGYYGPTVVVVRPSDDGGSSRGGRLIKGRGYTRGSSSGSAGGGRPSVRSGGSSSGSVGSTTRRTGSGSAGSSSTGRKAKRRGGGGGGGGLF